MHGDDIAVVRHRLQGDFVTSNIPGDKADLGVSRFGKNKIIVGFYLLDKFLSGVKHI